MGDRPNHTALHWLRGLGLLCIAVPLFIYAAFGIYHFLAMSEQAEQQVSRSLRVAHEHASRVIAGAEALQDRLVDRFQNRRFADLRSSQYAIHRLLEGLVRDQPQIQSIWLIAADGKAVASSRFERVPPDLDYTDRDYFRFHSAGNQGRYYSRPMVSRTTQERIVDISVRVDAADGSFSGVINVSLLTSYFDHFYSDLVADEPGLAVNLFREDGHIYTRWPVIANAPAALARDSPVMSKINAGATSGQVRGVSSVDGQDRLIAFKKVGSHPLYLGAGTNLSALRTEFAGELAALLALGLPPFAALYFTARIALRRTRESIESLRRLENETVTRRRAEEALQQAQKLEALGRLTGGVAHDFNNALMVVSNNVHLLKRDVGPAGQVRLDAIGRAVSSATKLTRQLLAFSRRQALLPEHLRLQDWLPELRELLTPVLGVQVALDLQVSADTHTVMLDRAELELALLNLAINARDAMPQGGTLTIVARNGPARLPSATGEAVVIEVTDTGTGMDAATLDRVFEPFYTTKPVGQGTGLGLSQVYGFCVRAGGHVSLSSSPGNGTVVRLAFPPSTAGTLANPPSEPPLHPLGLRVLLVEDNSDVAEALVGLLEALDCAVERVDRASAALERLGAGPLPDLVITDVVMPGELDGIGLAGHLRECHPGLPVVLMTGYAQHLQKIENLRYDVLPKPCSAEVLSRVLRQVVERWKAGGGRSD